jgi:hypothetical protein
MCPETTQDLRGSVVCGTNAANTAALFAPTEANQPTNLSKQTLAAPRSDFLPRRVYLHPHPPRPSAPPPSIHIMYSPLIHTALLWGRGINGRNGG